jgi:dipeptide/tripeptide permease
MRQKLDPKEHWLDYAEEKHGLKLVQETKMVLNASLMLLPIPIFWTLHMQQNSRWVFQGTRMNGDLGFYTIKPDQMIILNNLFSILMVPIFERLLFPLMAKIGIKTTLQKIACGMFSAAVAFAAAAFVEAKIEEDFIHIFWLTPQYFAITVGEILLYVQSLNFAYNEAPASMKSVMLSFVYLTMAGGNLFMVFISGSKLFESQVYEFLFFAGLMLVDMMIFIVLAIKYKYVKN